MLLEGRGLSGLRAMNRLSIVLEKNRRELLTLAHTSPKLVAHVDGAEITLTYPQWVQYWLADTEEARSKHLRQLAASSSGPVPGASR